MSIRLKKVIAFKGKPVGNVLEIHPEYPTGFSITDNLARNIEAVGILGIDKQATPQTVEILSKHEDKLLDVTLFAKQEDTKQIEIISGVQIKAIDAQAKKDRLIHDSEKQKLELERQAIYSQLDEQKKALDSFKERLELFEKNDTQRRSESGLRVVIGGLQSHKSPVIEEIVQEKVYVDKEEIQNRFVVCQPNDLNSKYVVSIVYLNDYENVEGKFRLKSGTKKNFSELSLYSEKALGSRGAGVIIGPNYVLTARHLFFEGDALSDLEGFRILKLPPNHTGVQIEPEFFYPISQTPALIGEGKIEKTYHELHTCLNFLKEDYIVLDVKGIGKKWGYPIVSEKEPVKGTRISIYGYPLGSLVIRKATGEVKEGKINTFQSHSIETVNGFSGAPLFTVDQQVPEFIGFHVLGNLSWHKAYKEYYKNKKLESLFQSAAYIIKKHPTKMKEFIGKKSTSLKKYLVGLLLLGLTVYGHLKLENKKRFFYLINLLAPLKGAFACLKSLGDFFNNL